MVDLWLLLGLAPAALMVLALIVLGAAFVRGLTGFGFAILAVPLMGLVIPPTDAVLLAIVLQTLIGPFGVAKSIDHIDRPVVAKVAVFAMMGTPLGLLALANTPHDLARLIIAAIAVGCFGTFLIKRAPQPTLRDAQVTVPASWRTLETVERGLVVHLVLKLAGLVVHVGLHVEVAMAAEAEEDDRRGARFLRLDRGLDRFFGAHSAIQTPCQCQQQLAARRIVPGDFQGLGCE